MGRLTRRKWEVYWDGRTWSVGARIYLKHVNYWFRSWMLPIFGPHRSGFLTRLALWLNDCWGVGWDIRERWESEYDIRIGYLEIYIFFDQKEGNEKMEQTRMDNTNEATEDECCVEVDPRVAKAVLNGELMLKCFDIASDIIGKVGFTLGGKLLPELLTKIAISLFERSTSVTPEQGMVVGTALEYLSLLMKDKEAAIERQEKLEATIAPSPRLWSTCDLGRPLSSAVCGHPGLRAIYSYFVGGGARSLIADIIDAMTLPGLTEDSPDFLLCSHCRSRVPVEKFKSGELWSEEAEASREAAKPAEEKAENER